MPVRPNVAAPRVAAVVIAGGRGTRFWPLSRRSHPKQVLAIGGGESLLAQTLRRVEGIAARSVVVTGPDMEAAVRAEAKGAEVIVEPSGRNTLPAIAWGTLVAWQGGSDTVVVLPSDHHVARPEALRAALQSAVALAQGGALVTLGVRPTRAETGFGWIEADGDRVMRFVEKPPHGVAEAMFTGGRHLWNAGMFAFRVDAFRAALSRHAPATAAALSAIESGTPVAEAWTATDATSIDYGVMEKHDDVRVVPLDCGWSDVGSWTALEEVVERGPGGAVIARVVSAIDAHDNLVHAEGKLVALLGVEGLVVVDTPDALLVARREDAQRVREVLADLDARQLSRYT